MPKSFDPTRWPQFTSESHAAWYLSLGNQAILAKAENEEIGNEPFVVKAPVLAASSLELTAEIGHRPEWTADEIRDRQLRLAELAVKTWPASV